jgi:hypothetical protein
VGGSFTSVGGTLRNNLAAVDLRRMLQPWNPTARGPVSTLIASGGVVYVFLADEVPAEPILISRTPPGRLGSHDCEPLNPDCSTATRRVKGHRGWSRSMGLACPDGRGLATLRRSLAGSRPHTSMAPVSTRRRIDRHRPARR